MKLATHDSYQIDLPYELLEPQGQLIDQLISFAFDTLGVRVLDLRIVPYNPDVTMDHHLHHPNFRP